MNRLKDIRERENLSQTELASNVGVSARHIAFIESGDRRPSINLALKIAKVLHVTLEEIFLPDECT